MLSAMPVGARAAMSRCRYARVETCARVCAVPVTTLWVNTPLGLAVLACCAAVVGAVVGVWAVRRAVFRNRLRQARTFTRHSLNVCAGVAATRVFCRVNPVSVDLRLCVCVCERVAATTPDEG